MQQPPIPAHELTGEARLRRLKDVHGEVSLGDRLWAADQITTLREALDERHGEHYGPYGTACQNTGQWDAGPCWKCQIKALQEQPRMLKEQLSIWKRKAGENQLVAGRYQYLFECAQKMINQVDDIFEYAYASMHPTEIKNFVVDKLDQYSNEVSKVVKSPTEKQGD